MYEHSQKAVCACGNGYVTRKTYMDGDDWNRYREGTFDEKIECVECARKYHLESISKSFSTPNGYETMTKDYLVPNAMTLKLQTEPVSLPFEHFAVFVDNAVARYPKEELKASIEDMKVSKYSTRVTRDSSKELVGLYQRCNKSRSLPKIIETLEYCVADYDKFEWTYNKVMLFREEENKQLDANKDKLKKTLSESYELRYEDDKS